MQRTFAKKPAESKRAWLGPALAGVLVLLLVLGGVWYANSRPAPQAPPDVGKQVAEQFLEQLRTGQAEAAWQSTTAEFKSDEGRESFIRYAHQHAAVWPTIEFLEYKRGELNGLPRGQAIFQPATSAQPANIKQVRIAVAQEEGTWKVEGLFLE